MKRKLFFSLLLLVIASALLSVIGVSALTGYTLDWWSADGGGETSSAGVYSVSGSIGQPDAGTTSSGGVYSIAGGFWGGDVAVIVSSTTLSNNIIAENKPTGSTVGTLSTATGSPPFTYSFACSTPGADDASFNISTNQLLNAAPFDADTKASYSICIHTTDAGSSSLDTNFTVNVTQLADKQITLNGGFETYPRTTPKIPTSWKAVKFGLADGKSTTHKVGKYAVQIAGAAKTTKTLTQTPLDMSGAAGDPFILSFWVKGTSIPKTGGLCQAQVLFYSGSTVKASSPLKCPTGSYTQWKNLKITTITAPIAYAKVAIKFTYSKSGGTIWFDGVNLLK